MYERYGERFAKIVCLQDVAEFERRALQLRPFALLLDEDVVASLVDDIRRMRKHPALKNMRILALCHKLSHEQRSLLYEAGADDILLTTQHSPRDIMARLQIFYDKNR
jgi:DNA-binding response OmpR family regulator